MSKRKSHGHDIRSLFENLKRSRPNPDPALLSTPSSSTTQPDSSIVSCDTATGSLPDLATPNSVPTAPEQQLQATITSSSQFDESDLQHQADEAAAETEINVNDIGYAVELRRDGKLDTATRLRFLKDCWVPPQGYSFPFTLKSDKGNVHKRYLSHQHLTGHNACFAYSAKLGGVFCKYCVLFLPTNFAIHGQTVDAFVGTPCTKFDVITTKLKKHLQCDYHRSDSVIKADALLSGTNVGHMLDVSRAKLVKENRERLKHVIEPIEFLARCGLAFRGHRDFGPIKVHPDGTIDYDKGNFVALLQLLAKHDPILREHICTGPSNAKYTSSESQNEIIQALSDVITQDLVKKINKAGYFALLADETTDSSHKEQMSICVRYLDISDGSVAIHEEFICFVHVEDLTGIGLATKLLETLDSLHITAQLVAQGYDGASAMSGKFNGVQAVIREQLGKKLAIYVHCAAHNLNLSLQDACKLDSVRAAITAVNTVTVFIRSSPQRTALLEKKIKELVPESSVHQLLQHCKTRWVEKQEAFIRFNLLFPAIIETLEEISTWGGEAGSNARNNLKLLLDSEYVIAGHIIDAVLTITKPLSEKLQCVDLDLVDCVNEIKAVIDVLRDLRSDDGHVRYNKIFDSAEKALGEPLQKPRTSARCRQKHRANPDVSTARDYFRIAMYNPFLDGIIATLEERFSSHAQLAFQMARLLPQSVVDESFDSVKKSIEIYIGQLRGLSFVDDIEAEFLLWKKRWQNVDQKDRPRSVLETLANSAVSLQSFPNIRLLLQVLATIPVTTATAERSFSQLRPLKSYLRSTMGQERLTGLAQLLIHKDMKLDIDKVIDQFVQNGSRRIDL
ncbi:hypothetical protein BOX15_Mlig007787g1 [Macrostomum lignano]|uniref:TTF-type domain-containing protein n=1 Tax=Macrostomum lignano TaxID=282301 RepID=A0A267E508_9PLAT|nr:hypothetical protein BOX15_Mlig007787g1 [Macrostomum lignano]